MHGEEIAAYVLAISSLLGSPVRVQRTAEKHKNTSKKHVPNDSDSKNDFA